MIMKHNFLKSSARMNMISLALWCCAVMQAQAQPTACKDESHCPAGFFCQVDLRLCHECWRCEDLRRRPPEHPSSCIQEVSDCGLCIDGYVQDIHGDTALCVEEAGQVPAYVWVAVVAGLLFLVIVVAIVVYALRNKELFKNVVSGETSVRSSRVNGAVCRGPEPPPPYNDQYVPVRPSSPPADTHEESTGAFMKSASAPAQWGAREAAGAQAAQVYNNPAYVRGPLHAVTPASYDSSEESEPHTPFTVHDEDTMESAWTPHENNENDSASSLPAVPEISEVTTVARADRDAAPPAKRPRIPQDSNNNQGAEGAASTSAGVTIITIVQQRNDVRL